MRSCSRLHLHVWQSDISGCAAEFDASVGTQKGADLITLKLRRGSSGDAEAALEKAAYFCYFGEKRASVAANIL